VVQEADRRQPPSNVDLAPPARGALLETFRVAAHAIQTVHAPVTLLVADRVAQAVAGPVNVSRGGAARSNVSRGGGGARSAARSGGSRGSGTRAVVVAVEDKYVI